MLPDPAALLALGDPAGALATLEGALGAEARGDDAAVGRELRAIAGGLDDGSHADLRARRFAGEGPSGAGPLLDAPGLRAGVLPEDVPPLLLDVAAAIAGVAA